MQYDNPAAHLHDILSRGLEFGPNESCRGVWAKLLDVDVNDYTALNSAIGKIMSLPSQIIEQTQELYPHRPPSWIYWEPQVRNAFIAQTLNGVWGTFRHHIDDHTINYLSMSASLIEAKTAIHLISPQELEGLRRQLQDLIKDMLSSNLPIELKKLVLIQLKKVLELIDDYYRGCSRLGYLLDYRDDNENKTNERNQ